MHVPKGFDAHYDHKVSLQQGSDMVKAYEAAPLQAGELKAALFSHKAFERILAQPGCKGIRIYLARHPQGKPTFVLVGVDAHGHDLKGEHVECSENTLPCPPFCEGVSLPLTHRV
jgi:hypothetical protein